MLQRLWLVRTDCTDTLLLWFQVDNETASKRHQTG